MRKLEFFYDYECPHCKRGYEFLLEALKKHDDISVNWCPCEAHPRPEEHPPHTDLCLQGYFYVKENGGDVMEYHKLMFDAIHTDRIDVEDSAVLAAYVSDLVDEQEYLSALRDGTYAKIQAEGNDYAYEKNEVWFLPAYRMDGKKLDAKGGIGVTVEEVEEFLAK